MSSAQRSYPPLYTQLRAVAGRRAFARASHRLFALPLPLGCRRGGGLLARAPAPAAHHAALAPGLTGLLRVELVRGALLMSRLAPLRGDLALPLSIHPREAASAALALFAGARHEWFPSPRNLARVAVPTSSKDKVAHGPAGRQGGGGDPSRTGEP